MINTCDLAYRYRDAAASTDLHFPDVSLAQGQALVLRGHSGSGKSTWLALVAGLRSATGGQVTVAGQDLSRLGGARRDAWRARHLGFLPQKLHLGEALTVADNLALVYFAAGLAVDTVAIRETLDQLGVGELAGRKPAQLSGGQAQRVALARAVLMRPQVLLADEPTASLDDASAGAALRLLADTASRCNATLVIATHDARVTQHLPACEQVNLTVKKAISA